MHNIRVLLAEDMLHERLIIEKNLAAALKGKAEVTLNSVDNAESAVRLIKQSDFDLVILDIDFSQSSASKGLTGLDASREIKRARPDIYSVIVSSSEDEETMNLAVDHCQVDWYFRRSSIQYEELARLACQALVCRLHREGNLLPEKYHFITNSPAAKRRLRAIDSILPEQNTLIFGETGTGKELIARRIHANARAFDGKRPFKVIDCSAFSENLFESEIFGHKKGAFTGAVADRAGAIQLVNGGDLFLDEIHNISPHLQQKLLRVLNDGIFSPVGSNEELKSKFRIIAATNQPIQESIDAGKLLPDFVARIRMRNVDLIPLRNRKDDIRLLAMSYLGSIASIDKEFSAEAISLLQDQPWPGNIRQLKFIIDSVAAEVKVPIVTPRHLKKYLSLSPAPVLEEVPSIVSNFVQSTLDQGIPLSRVIDEVERQYLQQARQKFRNAIELADFIGYKKTTLYRRLDNLGIKFRD
jgi:DNA-binding NtrC family response regulator